MAVRDVIKEYTQIESQYQEMLADVKDYEQAFNEGKMTEEQYEQALQIVDGLKVNYERWSYFMFILTKRKKYAKRSTGENTDAKENAEYLRKLKELKGKEK